MYIMYIKAIKDSYGLKLYIVNPIQPSAAFHIEIIHLIYTAIQITELFIKYDTRLKRVNSASKYTGINFVYRVSTNKHK